MQGNFGRPLEEFERPFSIDVISGHYILRDRFGPSKHLKRNTGDVTHVGKMKFSSSTPGVRFNYHQISVTIVESRILQLKLNSAISSKNIPIPNIFQDHVGLIPPVIKISIFIHQHFKHIWSNNAAAISALVVSKSDCCHRPQTLHHKIQSRIVQRMCGRSVWQTQCPIQYCTEPMFRWIHWCMMSYTTLRAANRVTMMSQVYSGTTTWKLFLHSNPPFISWTSVEKTMFGSRMLNKTHDRDRKLAPWKQTTVSSLPWRQNDPPRWNWGVRATPSDRKASEMAAKTGGQWRRW